MGLTFRCDHTAGQAIEGLGNSSGQREFSLPIKPCASTLIRRDLASACTTLDLLFGVETAEL
jgi:hypothetical protein